METRNCDDTHNQLTVERSIDGDLWIGVNNINMVRFRTMFGGGMSPNTYAAILNLQEAIKKDKARETNGDNLMTEWTNALNSIKK